MAGLFDWLYNGLNADQSPATSQLPAPLPLNNSNPLTTKNDPMRQMMIQKYLANLIGNNQAKKPMQPMFVGSQPNFMPVNTRLQMLMQQINGGQNQSSMSGY